jgi:hypothetical protein
MVPVKVSVIEGLSEKSISFASLSPVATMYNAISGIPNSTNFSIS